MATGNKWLVVLLLAALCVGCRPGAAWKPRYVIVVAIDTCRADHLGCYGYARPTSPNLDRLAREGVVFENAFSQSNVSLFSYASIFSGKYPRALGELSEQTFRMPAAEPTFPSILRSYGVATAAFVAGGHLRRQLGFGEGFQTYQDTPDFGSFYHTMPPAMLWLEGATHQAQPSLLFIHSYDVHGPYHKPMVFDGLYDRGYDGVARRIVSNPFDIDRVYRDRFFPDVQWDTVGSNATQDHLRLLPRLYADSSRGVHLETRDVEHIKATYDGSITYADTWIGMLRDGVERLGIADQTLIVVFGDHGEDLFDHGYVSHRIRLNASTLHVPLIVWGPGGLPAGRRVSRVVELRALGATLQDLLGLAAAGAASGQSLRPWLLGNPPTDPGACAVSEGMWPRMSVRMGGYRLTYRGHAGAPPDDAAEIMHTALDGRSFELYDTAHEPREVLNLLPPQGTSRWQGSAEALRERMGQAATEAAPKAR